MDTALNDKTVRDTVRCHFDDDKRPAVIRLECPAPSPHAVTIPNHSPLKVGTLAAILSDIGEHHRLTRDQLLARLF